MLAAVVFTIFLSLPARPALRSRSRPIITSWFLFYRDEKDLQQLLRSRKASFQLVDVTDEMRSPEILLLTWSQSRRETEVVTDSEFRQSLVWNGIDLGYMISGRKGHEQNFSREELGAGFLVATALGQT